MLLNCGLNKTLESPLDYKEIKPINPKGNKPWISIGRTDPEAEALLLWSPDAKGKLIKKKPLMGKIEGKRRRRQQRMSGKIASLTQWVWIWENSWRWCQTEESGVLQSMGSQRVRQDLATEQQSQPMPSRCFNKNVCFEFMIVIYRRIISTQITLPLGFQNWNFSLFLRYALYGNPL